MHSSYKKKSILHHWFLHTILKACSNFRKFTGSWKGISGRCGWGLRRSCGFKKSEKKVSSIFHFLFYCPRTRVNFIDENISETICSIINVEKRINSEMRPHLLNTFISLLFISVFIIRNMGINQSETMHAFFSLNFFGYSNFYKYRI